MSGRKICKVPRMNIPILGVVENMSYVECPNCEEKIHIFGESKIEDVAKNFGLKALGQIPMKADIAARCDAGKVEAVESSAWLGDAIDAVKELVKN